MNWRYFFNVFAVRYVVFYPNIWSNHCKCGVHMEVKSCGEDQMLIVFCELEKHLAVMGLLLYISQSCPCVHGCQHAYLHSQTCSSCQVLAVKPQMHITPGAVQVDVCIKIGFSAHKQKLLQVHHAWIMQTWKPEHSYMNAA